MIIFGGHTRLVRRLPSGVAMGVPPGRPDGRRVSPLEVPSYALPGTAVVPYAGAVPDGGRQGFTAAV